VNPLIIIVAFYPDKSFFENNLSLTAFNYVVIDNTPVSFAWFSDQLQNHCNVHYIANNANLGIAKGFNQGMEYAYQNGFDLAITMDQDSCLTLDIVESLIRFYQEYPEKDKVGVISPLHVRPNGTQYNYKNVTTPIAFGVFGMSSGNLLSVKVWKQIGGFCEPYFIDVVDTEYYARLICHGYLNITLMHVPMVHHLGNFQQHTLFGKNFGVLHHNYLRKFYQIRNRLLFIHAYGHVFPELLVLKKSIVLEFIKVFLYEKDKLRKVFYMFKGIYHYYKMRNNITCPSKFP
jgi:rhamnosyltransferase